MISRRAALGALAGAPALVGATDKSGLKRPVMGTGEHTYEAIHDWGELPAGLRYGNTHGVCQDRQGRIYVHHTVHDTSERHDSMVVFDPRGRFVKCWGSQFRGGAHGLHIRREGSTEYLYLCDTKRNLVVKTTLDGEEVWTIGYPEQSEAYRPAADGTRPKWSPTNLAVGPNGDVYVADGYGSSYVVQFDANGRYIRTFGGKGKEPGQLDCPHGITLDRRGPEPLLLVADRSNHRLQYFTLDGRHVRFAGGVLLPCHFDERRGTLLVPDLDSRVTLLDRDDRPVAHLGEGDAKASRELRRQGREQFRPGQFVCPHGACFDHDGNIFVVEWVEVGRVTKLRRV